MVAHAQLTTYVKENNWCTSWDIEHSPEASPTPPEPPNKPALQHSESPSTRLEGERNEASSCDAKRTSTKKDTSEASGSIEDAGEQSKKLWNMSECEHECTKRGIGQNSLGRLGEEPEELGTESVVPGSVHDIQEGPRRVSNEHFIKMNVLCQDTGPEGHEVKLEVSKDVEGNLDHVNVVNNIEHNGTHPSSNRNKHVIEMNTSCSDSRPGGHIGKPEGLRGVKSDWRCWDDVRGIGYNGKGAGYISKPPILTQMSHRLQHSYSSLQHHSHIGHSNPVVTE